MSKSGRTLIWNGAEKHQQNPRDFSFKPKCFQSGRPLEILLKVCFGFYFSKIFLQSNCQRNAVVFMLMNFLICKNLFCFLCLGFLFSSSPTTLNADLFSVWKMLFRNPSFLFPKMRCNGRVQVAGRLRLTVFQFCTMFLRNKTHQTFC